MAGKRLLPWSMKRVIRACDTEGRRVGDQRMDDSRIRT